MVSARYIAGSELADARRVLVVRDHEDRVTALVGRAPKEREHLVEQVGQDLVEAPLAGGRPVTPLHVDMTNYNLLEVVRGWSLSE